MYSLYYTIIVRSIFAKGEEYVYRKKVNTRIILPVLLMLSAAVSPVLAGAGMMTDIQYWLAPDQIQTTIYFDTAVNPGYHHRSNPARFVVEIPHCEYLWGDQKIPINDRMLQRIRVQRLNNGTLQIVFDLTEKMEAALQTFPQASGQLNRVVVTLYDHHYQPSAPPQTRPVQQIAEVPQRTSTHISAPITIPEQRSYIVVLDPGHGGRDPGAISRNGLKEKDIVLDLAQKMRTLIQQQNPYVQVYLTRDKDAFLTLPKRTEIAEQYQADLFVSLHVNANPSRKVQGFSVYTLSENATDAAAHELAEKENAVDLLFGVETPVPQNDSMLTFILADLSKTAWLQHSLEFGKLAVDTTIAALSPHKVAREGLKRANFAVLRTAAMPAVLVEACYISNAKEEKLLMRQDFRLGIAQSLADSIIEYFAQRPASGRTQLAQVQRPVSSQSSIAAAEPRVHVVKSGESLSVIAGKYNIELAQLRNANKIASADLIYVGQQLWIP
jgi:N-acetylmuramoyl-L-alanine amidase